ncbi:MAG: hypothetical protein Q4E46_02690 [Candidatus Saccharibacteria bacterium]|nr:hypothetical protein [Candidatus Saccharibacteria bacterium]
MPGDVFWLLVAIVIVGVLVYIAITISGNRPHSFDVEEYQVAWLKIENNLSRENLLSPNLSIINADKLLDKALNEMGVPGKTMGERMKKIGPKFSQPSSVWYAHKIRNQIAHEPNFTADYNQAKHALATYKQALKDLGAI